MRRAVKIHGGGGENRGGRGDGAGDLRLKILRLVFGTSMSMYICKRAAPCTCVVLKVRVPPWAPSITRHPLQRDPKKGPNRKLTTLPRPRSNLGITRVPF